MGQNTLQRAKANALRYGYCELCDDGRIFANKVRIAYKPTYQKHFEFKDTNKRLVRRNNKLLRAKGTNTTLRDVVFFLKQILIENRVKQQNVYSDTVKDVTRGSSAHRRRACRRLRSMWKRSDKLCHTPYNNLSFAKMQKIASCSNYAAHNMIVAMTRKGILQRKSCNIIANKFFNTKEPIQALVRKDNETRKGFKMRLVHHYLFMNLIHKEEGGKGCIRQYKGRVFVRMADIYKDTSHSIRKGGFKH